jgi:hypothetical protein
MNLLAVWVFCGECSTLPSGVFSDVATAESWIKKHSLSGVLTEYPLETGTYDWAIDKGLFDPKYPSQKTASFIGRFSSAYLRHFHYENGETGEPNLQGPAGQ